MNILGSITRRLTIVELLKMRELVNKIKAF